MEIADNLRCIFSAPVERRGERYVVEVPRQEVTVGDVEPGNVYRVALLSGDSESIEDRESGRNQGPDVPTPPVEVGDQRTVDIENIGEQGDGIARVERGYVVIVPDTERGERVTIEISDVRENVAFATVVEREEYYQ